MTDGSEGQTEVIPFEVQGLDQCDFLGSPPLFDFLFTRNSRADAGMRLEPNKPVDVVFSREARKDFFFVVEDSPGEVAGHAEVEDARFAGHDIDVEDALHRGGL